jgi:erythromycin esterase-like protein
MTLLAPLALAALSLGSDPVADGGAWVKDHAVALTADEAGQGFADLEAVGKAIGGARVVALGEPTHGTREAFQMKHRLLEYLVERQGFSVFSIEASMPEAYALSGYVIDGKGDPRALIQGMYFWTWDTEEVLAMVEWMRGWNKAHAATADRPALAFTGFDMQTPDVAFETARAFMAAYAPDLAEKHAGLLKDVKSVAARASLGSTQGGFTSATGSFPPEAARGKTLRFSAWIRTEGVTGWAGAWWRCDTPAGVQGFHNMAEEKITGTTPWTRHEFTLEVPKDTQNINFGFLLSGGGTAWFDDAEIELDGRRYEDPAAFSLDFENPEVQFLSGGSGEYAIARTGVSPHGGKSCLEVRRRPESEVPKADPEKVLAAAEAAVRDLESRREDLAKKAGPRETDWAVQNLRVVAQGARMYAGSQGFNARDRAMADNVLWILAQNPGRRAVLWAHNGHVGKAGYGGMKPMGSHLAAALGKDYFAVGFATGSGRYTAMTMGGGLKQDHELAQPPPGSIESVFAASGLARAFADVRAASPQDPGTAWAATPRPMRSIGALAIPVQFGPCTARDSYDALLWQARTTASRPLR